MEQPRPNITYFQTALLTSRKLFASGQVGLGVFGLEEPFVGPAGAHFGALTVPDSVFAVDYVAVLLGNGDGTFQSATRYQTGGVNGSDLVCGDVNGDGNLDFAVPNTQTKTISVLLGNGDGTFQTSVDYPAGFSPFAIEVGDFNHDGLLDIGFTQYDGEVSIMLNMGGQ